MKSIGRKLCFLFLPLAITAMPLHAQPGGDAAPATPAPAITNAATNTTSATATNANSDGRAKHPASTVVINHGPPQGGPTFPELVILTLITFLLPIAIVAMCLRHHYRRSALLHETLRTMIEKGVAIPPELLQRPARVNPLRKLNDFRNGMILVGLGLSLMLIKLFDDHARVGSVGLIPLCIGAAFLISWKAGQKSDQPGN